MNDKSSSSGPSIDADMKATGSIHIQDSFKIKIDGSRKTEDIVEALKFNRACLHQLKFAYAKSVAATVGILSKPSKLRRTYYIEILRSCGAMEGCKDALLHRHEHFDLDQHDLEHPNDAYKRLTPKFTLF